MSSWSFIMFSGIISSINQYHKQNNSKQQMTRSLTKVIWGRRKLFIDWDVSFPDVLFAICHHDTLQFYEHLIELAEYSGTSSHFCGLNQNFYNLIVSKFSVFPLNPLDGSVHGNVTVAAKLPVSIQKFQGIISLNKVMQCVTSFLHEGLSQTEHEM